MVAGLIVSGRFASTIISMLKDELIEYAKDQNKMQLGLKDELTRLEKALPKIQAVVDTVDQGLIREENPPLEKWLWKLRDAADQADDVMDEIKYNYEKERAEAEKNKVNKAITNFKISFLRGVDDPFLKRLKKTMKAIDEVAADVNEFYMLVKDLVKDQKEMVKSAINSRETSSALNMGTHVFGREKEKEDIIVKLLNFNSKIEGENFAVLPIIGVGGVGKTTLVQLVYNDPTVENHFELRMWVCISNKFDVVLLTKKLYEFVFRQRADFDSFDLIQKKLKEKLQDQRFLIVFDDVWNDYDKLGWDMLVAPLRYGKSGSMILLTTRLKAVGKLIERNVMDSIFLEGLNECDMWDLFKECTFGGEDPQKHKELVEIGRDIVKKLKGSPMAAKTVGGILCSNLNKVYWRRILDSELWSLEQGQNDIMPALRLTYQYLPPHLKPCFSFCSIFSKDHVFNKNDLVNMWIALGMVRRNVNDTMRPEEVGSTYFDDMLSKSIFIRSDDHYPFQDVHFVMHDLMHDLSILVSQGECLRTSTKNRVCIPNTIHHLYARIDGPHELSISNLKNLRTLILYIDESHHLNQDSLVKEMLKGMQSLRLLILFAQNLSKFPESASKLLHLRYLSINSSRMSAFPKSVSRLYLLETMVFNNLKIIQLKHANALGKLINLRHLIAPKLSVDRAVGIGRLTSLQELSISVGEESGFKMLSDMRELQSLRIDRIENIGSHKEVKQANLKGKVNLNELSLAWTLGKPHEPYHNDDLIDHLEPHPGLKELTIRNYMGTGRPPNWFRTQALSKLVCLTIDGCNFNHLPCLEELPLLRYIHFLNMNEIKEIIHKCNQSSSLDDFPSLVKECFLPFALRKLSISSCSHLETILPKSLESVNSLIELELRCCENITSLPRKEVFSRWKTLKRLTLEHCTVLASIESLLGLSCINYLRVRGCPELLNSRLFREIPSPLPLQEDETERVEEGTTQTSEQNDEINEGFSTYSRRALALFQSILCTLFYLVLRMFMLKLNKSFSSKPQIASPSSTMETGKTSVKEKPMLSVDELVIDDPMLLYVEPIRSLSTVKKLTIEDGSKLPKLPELPPFLQELHIEKCCPKLRNRCEKTGPDWPILSHIPKVIFKSDS